MTRIRDWRLLWTAGAISGVGDGALLTALPLLTATMTTDPRLIAGVTAWATLPWLLAALPAGVLADRVDARRALSWVQVAQGLLVGVLAALTLAHAAGIASVYAIAFGVGLAETMAKVCAQKLLIVAVAPADLERANGRQNAALFGARQFLGQPLGALLFAVSAGLPLWADAASFLVSAGLVAALSRGTASRGTASRGFASRGTASRGAASRGTASRGAASRGTAAPAVRRSMRRELGEGLRWLAGNRVVRTLSLLAGVANLANYLAMATFILFVRERVGASDAAYGVIVALTGAGGVLGSILSGRIVGWLGGRRTVTVTLFATPSAMLAIGLVARDVVTLTALSFVTSFGASLWNVAVASLRQRTVPAALMGRVGSVGLLLAFGTQPAGALLGGLVAGWWGVAAPWLVAGLLRLAAAVAALRPLAQWPEPHRVARNPATAEVL